MAATNLRLPILQAKSDLVELEPLALPVDPFTPQDVAPLQVSSQEVAGRTELRTSSYTIYVDLPGNADEMLLVHAYTGAYDRVSKRVATYLRSRETHHAPKPLYGDWTPEPRVDGEAPAPSDETMAILKKRGYLIPLTQDEEEALFVKLSSKIHHQTVRSMPGYVLMPTYQCNLRCPYCFQDHMRTDPKLGHLLRFMDREMADRILLGMRNLEAAHGIPDDPNIQRGLSFFGGEPLLAESRPTIEYFMNKFRERGRTHFSAISNATELEAYRDLIGAGDGLISEMQITLDGPPKEHDLRRIYPDGAGSYDRIAANIEMALDLGVRVNIRMNIDRKNIDQLPILMDEFETRGWMPRPNFHSYVAPITPSQEEIALRTTFTTWQLGRAMDELKLKDPRLARVGIADDAIAGHARRIFSGQSQGINSRFRTSFCSAHTTMYVIDAFADLYACWERTGDPSLRIGHIREDGTVMMNRGLLEHWRGRNVVSNPVCRKCRYATSCGGGCAALAEDVSGETYVNFCDGYAKRFRSSVADAYLAHVRGEKPAAAASLPCDA